MFDVLKINTDLLTAGESWTEGQIIQRAEQLARTVCQIWPVPEGHKTSLAVKEEQAKSATLSEMIAADLLTPGTVLHPRVDSHAGRTAVLLPDGNLDVDGMLFTSPSGAAKHIAGSSRNGWWFFVLEPGSKFSIRDLWEQHYDDAVEATEPDEEDDAEADEGD